MLKSLIFIALYSKVLYAQSFSFRHIDCKIRFNKSDKFLNKLAHQHLKKRGYLSHDFVNGNKMNVGDLYFKLKYVRDSKKLWKDCIVTASIMKAKNQKAYSQDKNLFSYTIKRSLPRHTFNGNERCTRALKDTFIHIPYCVRMTTDEKVRGN